MKILWRVKEISSGQENVTENTWPSIVTLTLNRHGCVMGSAHRLTKVNIGPSFNENPLKGLGDIKHARKGYQKLVTSDCDLDLEPTWLNYGFYTPSY